MLTTALLLGVGLVARPAAAPAPAVSLSIPALISRLVVAREALPQSGTKAPDTERAAWSRPTQLTHPVTGTTCTLLIVDADPGLDARIVAPPRPEVDPGIMGSASPCIR